MKASPKDSDTKTDQISIPGLQSEPSKEQISETPLVSTPEIDISYYQDRVLEGIFPMFLSSQSQALVKCSIEVDVTTEKMFRMVPKSDFIQDMATRLAISDFTPAKAFILEYPGESMMLHYDPEYKYGQNFFLVTSALTCDSILNPPKAKEEEGKISEEVQTIDGEVIVKRNRPLKWQSYGSEREIESEWIKSNGSLVVVEVSKRNIDFRQHCRFGDRDAVYGCLEIKSYKDPNYDLFKTERNIGIQAVPELTSIAAQTSWFRPVNFACQYEPMEMDEMEQEEIQNSEALEGFILNISPRLEQYLQQNEIMDIFNNDYENLAEEELLLEQGTMTILQEYQSFTDLVNSKDKSISCIGWHPKQKGVVAVSCSLAQGFDDRISKSALTKKHVIIIWSFHDPILPQLILESPENVACFQFNPEEPWMIVAGCHNGQLVMWDISEYQEKLQSSRKPDTEEPSSVDVKDKQAQIPTIKYIVVSSIELSHRGPITHLEWLPKHFEIGNNGESIESAEHGDKQLVTSSLDGTVAVWDLRFKKDLKALDLTWRPNLRVQLTSLDNSFDYSITKFSLRTNMNEVAAEKNPVKSLDAPEGAEKPLKKEGPKPLSSKFYCATEEGDIIYADWVLPEKMSDDKTSRVEFASCIHFGPMSDLSRNPFLHDIVLSIGGWSFHIWKEKSHSGPLISSALSTSNVTCGQWSPTRAGVFYIGRSDGMLEVWDLMDRSHTATTIQTVASSAVASISVRQYPNKGGQQYLAIGDDSGTLHILEVPKNLQKMSKNEVANISSLFERENRRLTSYTESKKLRTGERAAFEASFLEGVAKAAKVEAAKSADVTILEVQEEDGSDVKEEKIYLAMEHSFLEAEGIIAPAAD